MSARSLDANGQTRHEVHDLGSAPLSDYQTLVNMYLRDCAESRKELRLQWRPSNDAAQLRESPLIAAVNSWNLTRRLSWRIVRVYLLLALFMLLLAVAHGVSALEQLVLSLDQCVGTIALAHVYLRIIDRNQGSAGVTR